MRETNQDLVGDELSDEQGESSNAADMRVLNLFLFDDVSLRVLGFYCEILSANSLGGTCNENESQVLVSEI